MEVEGEATRRRRMRLAMLLLARRRAGAFMALVRVFDLPVLSRGMDKGVDEELDEVQTEPRGNHRCMHQVLCGGKGGAFFELS